MRLKKIKLLGFKSFGESTHVDFIDGITAIVGPNGCGKSNLADAFRWVLGEQSAKSLRGGRMQDVIFAGASSRKPLNFAEVSLTLTDINGALPIDYEELTVTRRVHRDGESEYFLNKHPVRLREVQSLFLDSGVGRSAFSIFEQGKIDQVIHLSPQERRVLFEEAAGILRFLQRKSEALRKLEQTDLNLHRAQDIHAEVERQIVVLERQAEEARLYKRQKEQFESLDKALLMHRHQQSKDQLVQVEAAERNSEGQVALTQQNLEARQADRQVLDGELARSVAQFNANREEILRTEGARDVSLGANAHARARLQEARMQESRWQTELADMQHKSASRAAEKAAAEQTLASIERQLQESASVVEEGRSQARVADEAVGALRAQQRQVMAARVTRVQEESRIQTELTQTSMRCEQARGRLAHIDKRDEQLREQQKELQQVAGKKQQEKEEASVAVEAGKGALSACEAQLKELAESINTAQKQLDAHVRTVADLKAREGALLRLRDEMEGFSKGSKRLLQESSSAKSPLCGKLQPLFSQIVPQPGFETAVAAILRPYSHALVIDTVQDLEQVLTFAQEQTLTDYVLICVELLDLRTPHEATAGGIALSSGVADSALARHFTGQAQVVTDGAALFAILCSGRARLLCSHDGYLCDNKGVLISPTKGGSDPFLREAELRTLVRSRQAAEGECTTTEQQLQTLRQRREQQQKARQDVDVELRRSEMRLMEVNFALQRAQGERDKLVKEREQLERDRTTAKQELDGQSGGLHKLQERLAAQKAASSEAAEQLLGVEAELARLVAESEKLKGNLRQRESAHGRAQDEQRKLTYSLSVLAFKEHEGQLHVKRLETELRAGQALQAKLEQEQQAQQSSAEELQVRLQTLQSKQQDLEVEVASGRKKIGEATAELDRQQNALRRRERELSNLRVQMAEIRAQGTALGAELTERYGEGALQEECSQQALPGTLTEVEEQVRSLRTALDSQQSVNMTSIEEYDRQRERYQFLTAQIGDLVAAKQELYGIISQLDEESRQLFKVTFEAIRANFRKNFQILFEGGEADLQLAEGVDLLAAGIEIVAKPPGKQLRSIQLLSGGEKCLTALALLFALFEVKPAPFCVLDEIDAPLDEANVGRFVHMVKHFVDRCQFIIITHNKTTMAIADVLVGVSMQEKGVSRVVSLTFAKEGAQGSLAPVVAG